MTAAIVSGSTIDHYLATYGYAVVFLVVMGESLGIPLPGETTLIAAALYAGTTGKLTIWLVVVVAAAGAIVGDNIGYAIGRTGGYPLLRRYGRYLRIDERRLRLGRWIFQRRGGTVVFFGRFVSILRTYAAFLAGVTRMEWRRFLVFNAAGGIVWATAWGVGVYYFGKELTRLRGPVDIGLGIVAAIAVVAFLVWLRRKEHELSERAERELED